MNPHLKSLAYRMLGSVADAEDVVQEAELRLHQTQPGPDNPQAFLYRVVSNLCIDKLRRERVRRREYFGPWLPEPLVDDDADLVDFAEQLSMGFLMMLEQLSPSERIVYVLREGFDFNFAEIGRILGVSGATARQRAHRARKRLAADHERPRLVDAPEEQKRLLDRLLVRVAEGDIDGIVALMSEDVVAYADGGGLVSATIAPVYGAERIARVTVHLAQKFQTEAEPTFEMKPMNGGWGVVISQDGQVHSCLQVAVADGLIHRVYVVRNPQKLTLVAG